MQLGGVLERAAQPRPEPPDVDEADPSPAKGRGVAPPAAKGAKSARASKRVTGRTVYLSDDLYERIIVQAHRRRMTNSDYIASLLDRHVPDHRVIRSGGSAPIDTGDTDAA
jgi:hypothetical protein